MRQGAPGNRVTRLTGHPGRANFSYVSLENALKRLTSLMLDRVTPPSRGTLSTCPRHPSRRAICLPCKRLVPAIRLAGVRTPRNGLREINP